MFFARYLILHTGHSIGRDPFHGIHYLHSHFAIGCLAGNLNDAFMNGFDHFVVAANGKELDGFSSVFAAVGSES